MAGFGERQHIFHYIAFTDFANQNDIRRLAHGAAQRKLVAVGIDANFALGDHRFLVLVGKLNWIFNSNDMARRTGVPMVDHRRQRG